MCGIIKITKIKSYLKGSQDGRGLRCCVQVAVSSEGVGSSPTSDSAYICINSVWGSFSNIISYDQCINSYKGTQSPSCLSNTLTWIVRGKKVTHRCRLY